MKILMAYKWIVNKFAILGVLLFTMMGCAEQNKPEEGDSGNGVDIKENCYIGKPISISKNERVIFSKGNLQYDSAEAIYRFAEQQYDILNVSINYIDLLVWKKYWLEWNDEKWRTLLPSEWKYILCKRINSHSLFSLGSVNGVRGLIILPDEWECPADCSFISSVDFGLEWQNDRCFIDKEGGHFVDNVYDIEHWRKMETNGAVFLPAGGRRLDEQYSFVQSHGYYWSYERSDSNEDYAYSVDFSDYGIDIQTLVRCDLGLSIRLVRIVN